MDAFEQLAEDYKQGILSHYASTVNTDEDGKVTVTTPSVDCTIFTQIFRADESSLDEWAKKQNLLGYVRMSAESENLYKENVDAYRELLESITDITFHQIFTSRMNCPRGTFKIGLTHVSFLFETSVQVDKESRMATFYNFATMSAELFDIANSKLTRKS
jgi:hypothetical protein